MRRVRLLGRMIGYWDTSPVRRARQTWIIMDPDIDFGALFETVRHVSTGTAVRLSRWQSVTEGQDSRHEELRFFADARQEDFPGVTSVAEGVTETLGRPALGAGKRHLAVGGGSLSHAPRAGAGDTVEGCHNAGAGSAEGSFAGDAREAKKTELTGQKFTKTGIVSLDVSVQHTPTSSRHRSVSPCLRGESQKHEPRSTEIQSRSRYKKAIMHNCWDHRKSMALPVKSMRGEQWA